MSIYLKLKVKKSETALFRIFLDAKQIRLENNGEASHKIASRDEDYVLSWFIKDVPGEKYSVEVTEPIKMKYETAIDDSGKDAPMTWFRLPPIV